MSIVSNFTDPYSAAESWAYDFFVAPAVARLADKFHAELPEETPHGGRVLDVGCGGGQNICALARYRPDLKITGVDLSREQIERAARRTRELDHVELEVGSALELPFADGQFDAVMSVASIKHWPDPRRGLEECVRVLRPGGILKVIEADRGCDLADAAAFVAEWRLTLPLLRPLALAFFRTWVAGQSLDVDEARELVDGLALTEASVRRLAGAPALVIEGTARR